MFDRRDLIEAFDAIGTAALANGTRLDLMEYLTFASPAEFKSRNVMTGDEPLRRANMPRT